MVSLTPHQQDVDAAVLTAFLPGHSTGLRPLLMTVRLFPNTSWFMMSNPKIPSQTPFVLSCSRATIFHRCPPSFTLTGTRRVCLPGGGLATVALPESQCQDASHWGEQRKRRRRCHDLWPSSSPPPPLRFPAFMLMVPAA